MDENRTKGGKKWIRLWVNEIFYGTTFQELNAEERGIWFSLLVMAGLPPREGIVEMRKGVPYKASVLAEVINCPAKELVATLNKLKSEEVQKIKIDEESFIYILNWEAYQTKYSAQRYGVGDYDRQKPYRNAKKYDDWTKRMYSSVRLNPQPKSQTSSAQAKRNVIIGDRCFMCEDKWMLETHHLDMNPLNNKSSNLVTLCEGHHKDIHTGLTRLLKHNIILFDYSIFWGSKSREDFLDKIDNIIKQRGYKSTDGLQRVEGEEEVEVEVEEEVEVEKDYSKDIAEVISHLNKKSGKHFSVTSVSGSGFVKSRLKAGYLVSDLIAVIDLKCIEWLDPKKIRKMKKYLRPETLFNETKFESYINEIHGGKISGGKYEGVGDTD